MLQADVQFDKAQLKALERDLALFPKSLPSVMQRGINDTLKTGRTQITREISAHVTVKKKQIRDRIKLTRAKRMVWLGLIAISGKQLPLIHFGARQTKKGVSVKVRKGGKRERIRSGFIATMPKSGHKGVFKRAKDAPRLPIHELKGPTVTGVFDNAPGIARRVLGGLGGVLYKNVARNVDLILQGIRKA